METQDIMLNVNNIGISFGGLQAVDNFNLKIKRENFTDLLDLTEQVKQPYLTF